MAENNTVYILMYNSCVHPQPYGVFSSEEMAMEWLREIAPKNGWTPGEIRSATVEPWPVDDFSY